MNVNQNFDPVYIIPPGKTAQVRKLKGLLKDAKDLYLATDEDREGEAISWHLHELLKPKVPVHRLVFHEITKEAIHEALAHPREIDDDLVKAQETRRIIDRLYGYEVSPLLWRKVRPQLSAGRVQSVAVRLIVERERQRMAFRLGDLLGFARARLPRRTASSSHAELRLDRWPPHSQRQGFRRGHRPAQRPRRCCCSTSRPPRAFGRAARAGRVPRGLAGRQALHVEALPAVHHQHAAAGGQPQAGLHRPPHDAGRPKPVRERSHHLHANRFDQSGLGGHRRARAIWWDRNTAKSICPMSRGMYAPKSRTRRKPTRPSARPAIPSTFPSSCAAS